jgi:hypothetical protein
MLPPLEKILRALRRTGCAGSNSPAPAELAIKRETIAHMNGDLSAPITGHKRLPRLNISASQAHPAGPRAQRATQAVCAGRLQNALGLSTHSSHVSCPPHRAHTDAPRFRRPLRGANKHHRRAPFRRTIPALSLRLEIPGQQNAKTGIPRTRCLPPPSHRALDQKHSNPIRAIGQYFLDNWSFFRVFHRPFIVGAPVLITCPNFNHAPADILLAPPA